MYINLTTLPTFLTEAIALNLPFPSLLALHRALSKSSPLATFVFAQSWLRLHGLPSFSSFLECIDLGVCFIAAMLCHEGPGVDLSMVLRTGSLSFGGICVPFVAGLEHRETFCDAVVVASVRRKKSGMETMKILNPNTSDLDLWQRDLFSSSSREQNGYLMLVTCLGLPDAVKAYLTHHTDRLTPAAWLDALRNASHIGCVDSTRHLIDLTPRFIKDVETDVMSLRALFRGIARNGHNKVYAVVFRHLSSSCRFIDLLWDAVEEWVYCDDPYVREVSTTRGEGRQLSILLQFFDSLVVETPQDEFHRINTLVLLILRAVMSSGRSKVTKTAMAISFITSLHPLLITTSSISAVISAIQREKKELGCECFDEALKTELTGIVVEGVTRRL
ncbi:hypothetical protein HDU67_009520 [Dinochytrium kinnereticum]|nr:hypothetical protein HDU67_009520 [Dinochytrium kinnereticum]